MRKAKIETKQDRLNKIQKYRSQIREVILPIVSQNGWNYRGDYPLETQLLQDMLILNPSKLIGFTVRIIKNEDGDLVTEEWLDDNGMDDSICPIIDINSSHESFTVNIPGYGHYRTYPDYVELIDDITLLYPTDIKGLLEQERIRKIDHTVKFLNDFKQLEKQKLENSVASYANDCAYHETELKNRQKLWKESKEKLSTLKVETFTKDNLKLQIAKIKKHKKIINAYMDDSGRITVLTDMLVGINPLDNKKTRFKIGRFYITFIIGERTIIKAYNLDYAYLGTLKGSWIDPFNIRYYHPNIKQGVICWGDHQNEVNQLLINAHLFLFIDFLIRFLSLYPHDGGNPYIQFNTWKLKRKKIPPQADNIIYTIGKELKKW